MERKKYSLFLIICFLLGFSGNVLSNDVQLSNAFLSGRDVAQGHFLISLDISWDNSWRTDDLHGEGVENWDAVWVFGKYRISSENGGDDQWHHMYLGNDGHRVPQGSMIEMGYPDHRSVYHPTDNPVVGVFIYRSENGSGHISFEGLGLRWDYVSNGLSGDEIFDMQFFTVEMVYITPGAFYLGSGGSELSRFREGGTTNDPFLLSSEEALVMGNNLGQIWATGWTSGATIPAEFPKGYAGFYCMKYSISQQQYVDFLNTLNYIQQDRRTLTSPSDAVYITGESDVYARNAIRVAEPGESGVRSAVYQTDNPYVSANYLSWADGLAYAAWAGLRPMSEMEYEKAARGFDYPVPNEFAWGTAEAHPEDIRYEITELGTSMESVTNASSESALGNVWSIDSRVDGLNGGGPPRVGIFATADSDRVSAGASYFGVMELSGSVTEQVVYPIRNAPRAYTGMHGKGFLDAQGDAEVDYWFDTDGEFENRGAGLRGGSHEFYSRLTTVSRRDGSSASSGNADRNPQLGFRAVRSTLITGSKPPENLPSGTYALTNDVNITIDGWFFRIGSGASGLIVPAGEDLWHVPDLSVEFQGVDEDGVTFLRVTRYNESVILPPSGPSPAYDYNSFTDRSAVLNHATPRFMIANNVPGTSVATVSETEGTYQVTHNYYGLRNADADGGITEQTIFEAASMTKPVFAYLVLQLVEKEVIDLDEPLVTYYGGSYELINEADTALHKQITARMVLNHTSGMPNWRPNASWSSITGLTGGDPVPVLSIPGSTHRYSGEGMLFLQKAIEKLTEKTLDEMIWEDLLEPLGMNHSAFLRDSYDEEQTATGHNADGSSRTISRFNPANAAYSLYTTPHDYALFLIEMMNPDRSASHSISAEMIDAMLTVEVQVPGGSQIIRNSDERNAEVWRSLGWTVNRLQSGDRFLHSGSNFTGFRCFSEFNPATGEAIVIMTNGNNGTNVWRNLMELVGEP
jgi:CubicO group peptidase (beta-lactamase class C family)/formylglycine-generating enzyme required for sulfatase activity